MLMIHDLHLMEILEKHRDILEDSFGKNLIDLRRKFSIYPDFKKQGYLYSYGEGIFLFLITKIKIYIDTN